MKKFTKVCLITGAALTSAGLLASVVALAAGGRESVREMAQEGQLDYRLGSYVVKVLHDGAVLGITGDDGSYCNIIGNTGVLVSGGYRYGEDGWCWDDGRSYEDYEDESVYSAGIYTHHEEEHPDEYDADDCYDDYDDGHYGEDYHDRHEDWEHEQETHHSYAYDGDGLGLIPPADEALPEPDMESFRSASGTFTSGPLSMTRQPQMLKLKAGCGAVVFQLSADDHYYIEHRGVADRYNADVKVTAYEENGILYLGHRYIGSLPNVQKNHNLELGELIVSLPKDAYFETVEVEAGACEISLGSLSAGKISVESGVSSFKADRLEADQLDIENGVGSVSIKEAVIAEQLEIENAVGSVELGLSGSEEDYHALIKSALGTVQVGDYHFTGIGKETERNVQAAKRLEIESGLGSVNITFKK